MNVPMSASARPQLDREAISRYVNVVFGYLDGLVPLRLLPEKGSEGVRPRIPFLPVAEIANAIVLQAEPAIVAGRGVFVVPGTVHGAGRARASDIAQTGTVMVDLDSGDIAEKRDHLVRHVGSPSLEIASGGITKEGVAKLHLYWRLTKAATGKDLATVAQMRAEIARKAGGDPSFSRLHQPIRVAGTIHAKYGTLSPVRLIAATDREYDLDDLAGAVAKMPAMRGLDARPLSQPQNAPGPSASDLATIRIRAGGVDATTRFTALSKVIGHWLRQVRLGRCDEAGAWAAIVDHNAAMIDPPWEDERLRREFDALRRRDIENHGPMTAPTSNDSSEDESGNEVPPFSEDALALTFAERHAETWRFVPAWGSWMRWTGIVWERDETRLVKNLVRHVCREAAAKAEKPGDARRIASEKSVAAVLRLASADPRLAERADLWDAEPMLLNTPGGVIDLETGETLNHRPGDHLTQVTLVAQDGVCPRWHAFLNDITDGDIELQGYLKRLAGYCLTGSTTEQVFAFLHGTGANGKSVFLQTIATILGSYAATATLDTFMASRADRHLTELAGLRAARLVLVTETEAGRSWAESRIKTVTGGERIRANYMRQDHFEFMPQFKLIVAGNHRPELGNVGEAMRRRLHVVPFTVTIPPERRDRDLQGRLLEEANGILGWMLEGCADWQETGLAPPTTVVAAAEDYFDAEDTLGQWVAECCSLHSAHRASSKELFASWKAWCEQNGFAAGSQKGLGNKLRARGFRATSDGKVRGWTGLALRIRGTDHGEVS